MDFIRRGILFAIGVGSFLDERITRFAEEMVERGKLTKEEAKTFAEDFLKRSREKVEEVCEKSEERFTQAFDKMGIFRKEKLDSLESKIKELEEELNKLKEKIG
jgi:polyhydroxyalkanoate synthesis regulator phasin